MQWWRICRSWVLPSKPGVSGMAIFHSIWTLILMVVFIAIVIWAWSSRKRKDFERAANIPLQDDNEVN